MGDGPADTLGVAIENIVRQYLDEWKRPPPMVELDAAWRFVSGPYRSGDLPLSRTAAKGRYKNKKEVTNAEGKKVTIYEYSERQVANRHREKAERLDNLQSNIGKLEDKVHEDLGSDDDKTRMTALAVALINDTYERVGNDESAANGHYGVTGWLKKHISFKNGEAKISYVGKSGVKQTKTVTDSALVKALKDAAEGKGEDEPLFDCEGCSVSSKEVNAYLKPFDITAKDLRGYHANREMMEALADIRSDGPSLPRDRKARDKILKGEFARALDVVAKIVGHETATLRNQYLVPHLEETYMKDGSVIQSLKKESRLRRASLGLERYVRATKTRAEKEDEQVKDKLVRRSPKLKPPRQDLRDHRIDTDEDPDLKSQGQEGDRDLSLNYKRVAALWKSLQGKSPAQRIAFLYLYADSPSDNTPTREEQAAGSVVKTESGKLRAKNKADSIKYFEGSESEQAKAFSESSESGDEESNEEGEVAPASEQWARISPEQQKAVNDHPATPHVANAMNEAFYWDGTTEKGQSIISQLGQVVQNLPEASKDVYDFAESLKSLSQKANTQEQWQQVVPPLLDKLMSKMLAHTVKATTPKGDTPTTDEPASDDKPSGGETTPPAMSPHKALAEAIKSEDPEKITSAAKEYGDAHPEITEKMGEHLKAYQEATDAANKAAVALQTATGGEKDKQEWALEEATKNQAKVLSQIQSLRPPTDEEKASKAKAEAEEAAAKESAEKLDAAVKDLGMGKEQYDSLTKDLKIPEGQSANFAQSVAANFKAMKDNPPADKSALKMRGKVDPKASPEDQARQIAVNHYVEEHLLNPSNIAGGLSDKAQSNEDMAKYSRDVFNHVKDMSPDDIESILSKAPEIDDDSPRAQQTRKMQGAAYIAYLKNGGDPSNNKLPNHIRENVSLSLPTNSEFLASKLGDDPSPLLDLVDGDPLDSRSSEKIKGIIRGLSPEDSAKYVEKSSPILADAYRSIASMPAEDRDRAKQTFDEVAAFLEFVAKKGAVASAKAKKPAGGKSKPTGLPKDDSEMGDYINNVMQDVTPTQELQDYIAAMQEGRTDVADPRPVMFQKAFDRFSQIRKDLESAGTADDDPRAKTLSEILTALRAGLDSQDYGIFDTLRRSRSASFRNRLTGVLVPLPAREWKRWLPFLSDNGALQG